MRTPSFLMIATACLAIAGCSPAKSPVPNSTHANACPIIRSFDWVAEAHPENGKKFAIVTGKVEVRSEGFTVSLAEGLSEQGPPPLLHVILTVTEPANPSAAKLTVHDVELKVPIAPSNQKVAIDCGGQEIERMDVVRP